MIETTTIETTTLGAHDPMPTGPGRNVIVLRRFEEEAPDGAAIQIILTGTMEETTRPRRMDGTLMDMDEAVEAAKAVAESEGLHRVFVVDRMEGEREQDILQHGGDHSVHMDHLKDTDEEEGERGPDMRDIAHPGPARTPQSGHETGLDPDLRDRKPTGVHGNVIGGSVADCRCSPTLRKRKLDFPRHAIVAWP